MRPQDIVILLKITTIGVRNWRVADLANSLEISQSEVSESLERSKKAGLINYEKKEVFIDRLLEFLVYGIRYVFPANPDWAARGMPSAHSAKPLRSYFKPVTDYIWRYSGGELRGRVIEPLHPRVPFACLKDVELYQLLTLVDSMRLGIPHIRDQTIKELKNRL